MGASWLDMWVDGRAVFWPGIFVLGLGVGYLAGMFGVGGGFLLTPLLNVVFGIPLPVAAGTSLCQMVGTATVAFLRHQHIEQGEARFDLLMLVGAVVGGNAGTSAVAALARAGSAHIGGMTVPWIHLVLDPLYIAFLAAAAVTFWWRTEERHAPGPFTRIPGLVVDLPRTRLRASAWFVSYVG